MSHCALNPYLPLDEYIPDGEPRVFGDRLYVFGSHDRSHGKRFCMNDYVCWSAPVDDLANWRCEGVIFRKLDSPNNPERAPMFAPDVVQGPDGRYYLFFGLGSALPPEEWIINVAVCDTPAGRYRYHGTIDLRPWSHDFFPFDPGVLVDDDGRVWLYYGFGSGDWRQGNRSLGGAVVELAQDMVTVLSGPKPTLPNKYTNQDAALQGHAFFEASSIRKIDDKYCFIYSSEVMHELCYAVSDRPDGGFVYQGVLISNADHGLNGSSAYHTWWGNNHGSLAKINGQWYIFYHRHTQQSTFSRQACAEKIVRLPDGRFLQAECTSCGLNPGPLPGEGWYSAAIAAQLHNGPDTGESGQCRSRGGAYIDEESHGGVKSHMIKRFSSTACAVYKFFAFRGKTRIRLRVRGRAQGALTIRAGQGSIDVPVALHSSSWQDIEGHFDFTGTAPLTLTYTGSGHLQLLGFELVPLKN